MTEIPRRELLDTGFPEDDGAPDPELRARLAATAGGVDDRAAALDAVTRARLLVPVVAVLGEVEYDEQGLARDKSSEMPVSSGVEMPVSSGVEMPVSSGVEMPVSSGVEMAAVLLTGLDGRRALLAFTGMDSLLSWRADARPVPVTAQVAAASAVQEGAGALLVDVAGPTPYAVEGDDLDAIARGWTLVRVGAEHAWVEPA